MEPFKSRPRAYFICLFLSSPLSGALSDLAYFRKQNPSARLLASLGGDAVGPAVFSGLLEGSSARLSNLTSSVNGLFREGVIDGVEIDWEWPAGSGDKDDREKLVKYARVREPWNLYGLELIVRHLLL